MKSSMIFENGRFSMNSSPMED